MSNYEEFEALKMIGYMNLDKDQRTRYSELKKENPQKGAVVQKVKPVEPKKEVKASDDDRIAKLERLVANLSNENNNLRDETSKLQDGWAEYTPLKETNKTATVKIYRIDSETEPGVITKLVTFKDNAFNEETRKYDKLIYNVTVRFDSGDVKELKVDAMDFVKMKEIEKIEIIKEDRKVLKKVQDFVTIPDRDGESYPRRMLSGGSGYGSNVGASKVPLEVFRVKSTVTIRRTNGQEFEMESDYLNL